MLALIMLGMTGCRYVYLHPNPMTPCGDRRLAILANKSELTHDEALLYDKLYRECIDSRPCSSPRLYELIRMPRDLTTAEYAEIDRLMDDCENWETLRPTPSWKYVVYPAVIGLGVFIFVTIFKLAGAIGRGMSFGTI